LPLYLQPLLDTHEELIIDLFAGGGGASSGIEQATGRMVDIAINHDAAAVAMHEANHPQTKHLVSDVFEVCPREVTEGRPVAFLWASPDCTDHSKAKGGKPIRTRKRRALAWVVKRWAGQVRPRVIMLENVEEFVDWSPLVGTPGNYRRCPKRRGKTFRRFITELRNLGYEVEWRELRACDYGAPTIRKRLYLIARCDGQPIVWPEASHCDPKTLKERVKAIQDWQMPHLKPWRPIADCIDWRIPMLSIFATKEEARAWAFEHGYNAKQWDGEFQVEGIPIRPLAENTMRRIARGIKRYVIDNPKPYTVPFVAGVGGRQGQSAERSVDQPFQTITAKGDSAVVSPIVSPITHGGDRRTPGADEPLATITCSHRGEQALIAPHLIPRYGEREGQEPRCRSVEDPSPVIVPGANGGSLVAGHLSTYYGGEGGENRGVDLDEPLRTQGTENRFGVVAAHIQRDFGQSVGHGADVPTGTITGDGQGKAALVASFLGQNNGGFADGNTGDGKPLDDPATTITGKGANQSLIASSMVKLRGTSTDADPCDPLDTVSAGGTHHGIAAGFLDQANNGFENRVGRGLDGPSPTICAFGSRAPLVAAFLNKFYGQGVGQELGEPGHTITAKDRFGLVTVDIRGEEMVMTDICMRMLQPRELYLAQGFRPDYIIDRGADGRVLNKTDQVRMCGNSVCPPVAEALVRANCPDLIVRTAERPRRKQSNARQAVAA